MTSMRRRVFLVAGVLCACAGDGGSARVDEAQSARDAKDRDGDKPVDGEEQMQRLSVIVHRGGRAVMVVDSALAERLADACRQRLLVAHSVLRLAVTKAIVDRVTSKELAVEVEFGDAQQVELEQLGRREVAFTRLLVPLSGEFASGMTTVFVGSPGFEAGPYRATDPPEDLVAMVKGVTEERR